MLGHHLNVNLDAMAVGIANLGYLKGITYVTFTAFAIEQKPWNGFLWHF